MKIVVCETCGRMLHRAGRCYHCGGKEMYPAEYPVNIHSAAAKDYAEMNRLLAAGDFDRVMELSERVLEWMSFSSDVYWMRMLAAHHCATDRDLILRGAALEEDPDYYNAIRYAETEEHQVYLDLKDKMECVKTELTALVRRHFAGQKQALELDRRQQELTERVSEAKETLMMRWSAMEDVESSIRTLEAQSQAALRPTRESLKDAKNQADAIRQQVSQIKECDETEFRAHMLRMAGVMQMSEEAKDALRTMIQDHPWAEQYQSLTKEREWLGKEIRQELEELTKYTNKTAKLLADLDRICQKERAQLQAMENGDFTQARQLLGEAAFAQALSAAGVAG